MLILVHFIVSLTCLHANYGVGKVQQQLTLWNKIIYNQAIFALKVHFVQSFQIRKGNQTYSKYKVSANLLYILSFLCLRNISFNMLYQLTKKSNKPILKSRCVRAGYNFKLDLPQICVDVLATKSWIIF